MRKNEVWGRWLFCWLEVFLIHGCESRNHTPCFLILTLVPSLVSIYVYMVMSVCLTAIHTSLEYCVKTKWDDVWKMPSIHTDIVGIHVHIVDIHMHMAVYHVSMIDIHKERPLRCPVFLLLLWLLMGCLLCLLAVFYYFLFPMLCCDLPLSNCLQSQLPLFTMGWSVTLFSAIYI